MKENLTLPRLWEGRLWPYRANQKMHFPHRHDELEGNLVLRGEITYIIDGSRFVLRRGTQLWLFPDQEHLLIDRTPDCEMWIVVWKRELLRRTCITAATAPLARKRPDFPCCAQVPEPRLTRLHALCQELFDAERQEDLARINAGLAYLLLACWHAHHFNEDVLEGARVHPAVEKAARLLRDDPEAGALPVVAERVFLSSSRLSRLFKQQTGVSLAAYRNRQRLNRFFACYGDGRGKNMLRAALEAGFGSYPQFHRVFRQLVGCSPADHRRENLRALS